MELLGRQSLPVFCAHVVLAMLVLAFLGGIDPERPLILEVVLLTACFAVLYAVALTSERVDREAARAKERLRTRRAQRRAGGARSRAATARSHPD